jgi:hypothetical protein
MAEPRPACPVLAGLFALEVQRYPARLVQKRWVKRFALPGRKFEPSQTQEAAPTAFQVGARALSRRQFEAPIPGIPGSS